ncbi:MAG: DUF5698 domain-containing protein [Chloroflexi bacterium]|nr:DUF5698 domain-containing protein [Chloroflexota bacterium]MCI0576052.1 DUF5698 domain-containing protein [Chloroflexota bacterium]MCI0647840.1 DUF5698 domain-containing protein [Chloroflexota bacterium]MCI0727091.1 DUF5698 domain-containing protein [Chloroflexota bacterium]
MPEFEIPALTGQVISAALFVFVMRVIGVALATVRVLVMTRGRKLLSASMGFFEVLVYVLAIGQVVNDLANVWNLLGYCLGFAAGTLIGMALEERMALGFATVRIISRYQGQHLAEVIRQAGYGATIEWGQGRNGAVSLVNAIVRRKEVNAVVALADQIDPDAFVTIEETRTIRRGYMRIARHER